MMIKVNCPKCPKKVYIKKRRNSEQKFITDNESSPYKFHRNTCPSGNFIDADILDRDISYDRNKYSEIDEYRGYDGIASLIPDIRSYATKFNKCYSDLLGGKKIYIVKYINIDYIEDNYTLPKDYIKTDYFPIIVDSISGESLIWVCDNRNYSESDSWINDHRRMNRYFIEYNKFFLFDRKMNIIEKLENQFIYDLISDEITEDNKLDITYELLSNEINNDVVSTIVYDENSRLNTDLTGIDELQKILELKKDIGEKGEEYVLSFEKNELKKIGLGEYSKFVEQISKSNVAAGYDILSYTKDGRKKYIEVKTSSYLSDYFYMSLNEWETAKKLKDDYYLYIVVLKPKQGIEKIITNPVLEDNKTLIKEANSFKIKFR